MPNPAPPARRGDPQSHPCTAPAVPTKEAATTHPGSTQPTPSPPSVGRAGTRQATGEAVARRAGGATLAGALPGGRRRPSPGGAPAPDCAAGGRQMAKRLVVAGLLASAVVAVLASPAYAASGGTQTLSGLISNLTTWIVGILAGVATLFLTIGGLRYLTAGGDPGQVEKAKTALKSAAVGYALAVLAPLIVSILASLVGGG